MSLWWYCTNDVNDIHPDLNCRDRDGGGKLLRHPCNETWGAWGNQLWWRRVPINPVPGRTRGSPETFTQGNKHECTRVDTSVRSLQQMLQPGTRKSVSKASKCWRVQNLTSLWSRGRRRIMKATYILLKHRELPQHHGIPSRTWWKGSLGHEWVDIHVWIYVFAF